MNKKKIGIITFHSSHNCGSMLQAYALQTVLEKRYGAEVEIIDFSNKGSRNLYGLFDFRLKRSALKHNLLTIRYWKLVNQYRRDYINFKEKYLHTTERQFRNHKELESLDGKYDVIIAGGDQVWNVLCPDADDAYFLDFIHDSKKAAYSPSLGGNNLNEVVKDTQKYRRLLNEFDFISVREPNGKKWLEQLIGREVPIIADPTLLLSGEDWNKVATNVTEEHYIFVYSLSMPNEVLEFANKLAKSKHEKIVFCTLDNLFAIKNKNNTVNPSPEEFLGYIKNADYVVTNSFHGTVFSIIFKKVFFVIKNVNPNHDNSRLTNVLSLLGLESQLVDSSFSPDNLEDIDYLDVENKLEAMKKLSKAYINRIISE